MKIIEKDELMKQVMSGDYIETDLTLNPIVKTWFKDKGENLGDLIYRYDEPHRYYHNIKHLRRLLHRCEESELSYNDKMLLQIVILFHDIVYDPRNAARNELESAEVLNQAIKDSKKNTKTYRMIWEAINGSDYRTKVSKDNWLFKELKRIDIVEPLFNASMSDLIANEALIRKEYQFTSYEKYVKGRLEFLNSAITQTDNIKELIKYIENYTLNVGLYAGSFNPFHIGHLDILEQAEKHFDKVIVLLAINPDKNKGHDDDEEAKAKLSKILPFHEVDYTCGLLTHYIDLLQGNKQKVTVVRGLRNGYDLDYELNIKSFMDEMKKDVNFVYFVSGIEKQHVSSSAIRGIEKFDKYEANKYIPNKYTKYYKLN